MDFVDVVDVVSAVLRQLKAKPYGESYFIRRAITLVKESIEDLVRIKNISSSMIMMNLRSCWKIF